MYLEIHRGGKEEVIVLDILAWSHGLSRRSYSDERPKKKYEGNPELNQNPKQWDENKVNIWLKESGLDPMIHIFQSKIRGKDLFFLSSDLLKEMGVDVFSRMRFESSFSELSLKWSDLINREDSVEDDLNSQDLSVTSYFDDRAILATFLLLSNSTIPKVYLTNYQGNRRRRHRQIEEVADELQKAKENEPIFRMELNDVKFSSVSLGGSGGEDRFTCNFSLSYKSFCFIGQQFPADSKKSYQLFYPAPFGIEVRYEIGEAGKEGKSMIREWGKIIEWNFKTHYSFPKEFQIIVKTMLMVHQNKDKGNYIQFLPDSTLHLIFQKLSHFYIPTSPLSLVTFPGPINDGNNNNDDDYY